MQLYEAKQKRKKALIAVCTLGLSETPLVKLFDDAEDDRRQMSFSDSILGDIFKIIWFLAWTVITMAILWIVNIFKLIIYAEYCHRLEKKTTSL